MTSSSSCEKSAGGGGSNISTPAPGQQTFALTGARDVLRKLEWEIGELHRARHGAVEVRICHALNCAVTAWHMTEWVWRELDPSLRLGGLDSFQGWCRSRCPELGLCRHVATAAKHLVVEQSPDPRLSAAVAEVWQPFRFGDPVGRPLAQFEPTLVIRDGAEQHEAIRVFGAACRFWHAFCTERGL